MGQIDKNEFKSLDNLFLKALKNTEDSNFDTALFQLNQLYDIAEEQDAYRHLVLAKLNTGVLFYRINDSEEAINYYFKALDLAKKYKIEDLYNSIYNNLGIIYSENNEIEKALGNFEKALEISRKREENYRIGINLINIGNVKNEMNEYEAAIEYFTEARLIFKAENDINILAAIYNNFGNTYNEQDNQLKAKENYEKALELGADLDKFYFSSYLFNLGRTYYNLKEFDSAIVYLDKSLQLSIEVNHKENIIKAYTYLAKNYQEYGYVNKALLNYGKSNSWKDSLLAEKSQKWISEMQMKYEFGKKVKEVEFLTRRNKMSRIIWFLSISILLIAAFFMYNYMRNRNIKVKQRNEILRQEKELAKLETERAEAENRYLHEEITATEEINRVKEEKYKQEIEHKNRELTSKAMHVVNKNEILADINERLKIVDPDKALDTVKQLHEIKRIIKSNVNLDEDWEVFKLHFEEVHRDFFNHLNKDYPDLSQGDMRLCAYLVINLNSKEIAQIFNISPDSVRKRKQRLREKLDLPKEAELIDFLLQYS